MVIIWLMKVNKMLIIISGWWCNVPILKIFENDGVHGKDDIPYMTWKKNPNV
jgi:hypothetical protein